MRNPEGGSGPRMWLTFALLALAPLPAVHAAAWQYIEPRGQLPFSANGVVRGNAGAIWSFDLAAFRRSDADGSTLTVLSNAASNDFDGEFFFSGVATPDGGLIAYTPQCHLQRIAPDGRATWLLVPDLARCTLPHVGADGTTWIGGIGTEAYEVNQIGLDGTILARRRAGGNAITNAAETDELIDLAALDAGGAVELTHALSANDAALTRRDANANLLWRTTLSGARDRARFLASGADGETDIVGALDGNVWISHIDAQGNIGRTQSLQLNAGNTIVDAKRSAEGTLHVVTGEAAPDGAYPRRLLRIGADGTLLWEQDFCPMSPSPFFGVHWDVARDGTVANTCGNTLVIRRSDGVPRTQALPFRIPYQVLAGDNGEWLAFGIEAGQQRPRLFAIGMQTREISLGPATQIEARRLLAANITEEGNSYLLSYGGARTVLTRLDPDGTVRWQRQVQVGLLDAHLDVRAGTVCASDSICVRESDGVPLAPSTLPVYGPTVDVMRPINGMRVVRISADDATFQVQRIDASAATNLVSGSGRLHNVGIAHDGSFVLAIDDRVERYALDGRLLFRVSRGPIRIYQGHFVTGDDGTVYVSGRTPTDDRVIRALDANGTTRWQVTLPPSGDTRSIIPVDGAVYVHGEFTVGSDYGSSYTQKLAAGDGRTLWTDSSINRPNRSAGSRSTSFALSADGREVAILSGGGHRLRLERLDAGSGAQIAEQSFDCEGRCSQPSAFALDANGEGRAAYTVTDRLVDQKVAARSFGNVLRNPPVPIRIDQPGIAGAWWPSYLHGEGLTFEWLPASRTLFGTWFTYSADGGNDPAQLRWYTLQAGGIASNTTRLELPILATNGGNFAAGPAVSPLQVGRAVLTFTDCNNAVLEYDFDAGHGGGREGSIALSRLTASALPCVLADGSVAPPSGVAPPSNGFDANLSGTWFDESAIGQGLQLTVQPGGVFFAPWFTFDPAGTSNDTGRQHWFTLQGNLADARDGVAPLVLVQTIGGTFDLVPTYNANAVGTATLHLRGCDRAELVYRFDDTHVGGAFRARNGTLQLMRAGGCAP